MNSSPFKDGCRECDLGVDSRDPVRESEVLALTARTDSMDSWVVGGGGIPSAYSSAPETSLIFSCILLARRTVGSGSASPVGFGVVVSY